jgi:hypothetical protein
MIYSQDVDVALQPKGAAGWTGVLAQQARLSINTSAAETYSVGRKGSSYVSANGPADATLSISYLLEAQSEPCFEVVRLLKDNRQAKTRISFAGTTGDYYLNSYNINSAPNRLLQASVVFHCYDLISGKHAGNFGGHGSAGMAAIQYNTTKSTTNGWSTYLVESGNHPRKNPTFDLSYSFEARHEPVYVINKQVPSQVEFYAGKETVSSTKAKFYNAHVSGISGQEQNLADTGSYSGNVTFAPVLLACSDDKPDAQPALVIDLSGAHIMSTDVSVGVSDFPKTRIVANKYF